MDMEMITDLMEAVMILCFGLSWPISIRKSWVSRTCLLYTSDAADE